MIIDQNMTPPSHIPRPLGSHEQTRGKGTCLILYDGRAYENKQAVRLTGQKFTQMVVTCAYEYTGKFAYMQKTRNYVRIAQLIPAPLHRPFTGCLASLRARSMVACRPRAHLVLFLV
jgi:hypothetical protein